MTLEEKIESSEFLDEMGVDIIEAGYSDFIARRFRIGARSHQGGEEATVCGLARAASRNIDAAGRSAERPQASAHPITFISQARCT